MKVQESPEWLKERLVAVGLRPINNIVDITNFVLHELGTPLHAFDAAKVQGGIVTRTAYEGETIKALDGQEYTLNCTDLVVADQSGNALAIGGVMGGEESGVTDATTDIILESAWFKPSSVRATSRRLALSSDSSYRFERGTSAWNVLRGSVRAVELILQLAGGTASPTYVAGSPVPNPAHASMPSCGGADGPVSVFASLKQGKGATVTNELGFVQLPWKALDQISGGSISHEEGARILTALGLKQVPDSPECWLIPPTAWISRARATFWRKSCAFSAWTAYRPASPAPSWRNPRWMRPITSRWSCAASWRPWDFMKPRPSSSSPPNPRTAPSPR